MLLWATELPLKVGVTNDDLLELAEKWLIGSPYSNWKKSDFGVRPENEIVSIVKNDHKVFVGNFKKDNKKWCGLCYDWIENNERRWTTEIVGYHDGNKLLTSVQVNCEQIKLGLPLPNVRKPYIVQQIIRDFWGGKDGGLPISDKPHFLEEQDVDFAARIMNGSSGNRLPVVYVSIGWNDKPVLDVNRFAEWASGLAHIVVEPSRHFSLALSRHVKQQNAYGGAVAVYWPAAGGAQFRIMPERYQTPSRIASVAADVVRKALASIRPTECCTWEYLREQIASSKMEELKKSGSKDLNDYVTLFNEEMDAKNTRIAKLESEIVRLRNEIQRANAATDSAKGGILTGGKEKPFYSGEIRDVVIRALKTAVNQFHQDGRCQHILNDLLSINHESDTCTEIASQIKSVLASKSELDKNSRKKLEELGFIFGGEAKHIKFSYHNDDRYTFTIQKTGSDWRGMKNMVSEICKVLFK